MRILLISIFDKKRPLFFGVGAIKNNLNFTLVEKSFVTY